MFRSFQSGFIVLRLSKMFRKFGIPKLNFVIYLSLLSVPFLMQVFLSATIGQSIHQLLVVQALRPDRLLAACHLFVTSVMGKEFMTKAEHVLDLGQVVEHEVCLLYFLYIFQIFHRKCFR